MKEAKMSKNISTNWINANVHSWSTTMSQVLESDMPQLVAESALAVLRFDADVIKKAISPSVWNVIDKIHGRKSLKDKDLRDSNPLGLLQIAWEETEKNADGMQALTDLLQDIGSTCLQGDTHRLFFYIYALKMSKLSSKKV